MRIQVIGQRKKKRIERVQYWEERIKWRDVGEFYLLLDVGGSTHIHKHISTQAERRAANRGECESEFEQAKITPLDWISLPSNHAIPCDVDHVPACEWLFFFRASTMWT